MKLNPDNDLDFLLKMNKGKNEKNRFDILTGLLH